MDDIVLKLYGRFSKYVRDRRKQAKQLKYEDQHFDRKCIANLERVT